MIANDQARLGRIRAADVVEDPLKHLQQERSGAAGEVEHGDLLVVGEAVLDGERDFENVVDGAHDEVHDRRRRVIDAARFLHLGVIFAEEILVEINERVALEQPMLLFVLRSDISTDRLAVLE